MVFYRESLLLNQYATIFFVVASYWVVSILTVFVNKTLLSELDIDAPFFIASFQTFLTFMICFARKSLSKRYPKHFNFAETHIWEWSTLKNLLPVSLAFTAMIGMNNLCLKYVSVAFYYVGRSLTTIFNVCLTYLVLREKISKKCLTCCLFIIFGFYLGVDQENLTGSFSISGTIFGVLASLSLSFFSILTKKVLPKVNNDIWILSYYNNFYSSIAFLILTILNGEVKVIPNYSDLWTTYFWFLMTFGGICGFAVGFMSSLQIKYTSALTHNISGTAKACAQTILARYWYNDVKSWLWWVSNAVVLFSSAAYARIKQIEMERKHSLNDVISQKV